MSRQSDIKRRLQNQRRRVNKARNFPTNTCPASRHLHMIADALASGKKYHMLDKEPEHCASTMYSVLESLWTLRTKHPLTAREKAAQTRALQRAFEKHEAAVEGKERAHSEPPQS